MLSCLDIREFYGPDIPNCCISCHEDDEKFAMDMCFVNDLSAGEEAHVCCTVAVWLRKIERMEW